MTEIERSLCSAIQAYSLGHNCGLSGQAHVQLHGIPSSFLRSFIKMNDAQEI